MPARTVQILCPSCNQPVTRTVPVRDGDDGVSRPLPLLATGVCEPCWPWEPEMEQVAKRRTAWAVEQEDKARLENSEEDAA